MNKFISKIVVPDSSEGTGYFSYDIKDTEARNTKADKATTASGYGITDVYTKIEIDDKIDSVTIPTITTSEIDNLLNN